MYNALKDNHIAGAIASPFLSTLFAIALLASGQNSTVLGPNRSNRYGRFLEIPPATMGRSSHDSDHCPSSCHHRCDLIWRSGTCPRRPSSLLSSLPISGSSILHLPSGLFHLQQRKSWENMSMRNGILS